MHFNTIQGQTNSHASLTSEKQGKGLWWIMRQEVSLSSYVTSSDSVKAAQTLSSGLNEQWQETISAQSTVVPNGWEKGKTAEIALIP